MTKRFEKLQDESWREQRPRPVWIATLLLVIQAAVFWTFLVLALIDVQFLTEPFLMDGQRPWEANVPVALAYGIPVMATLAAATFLTLYEAAWNAAMLTQVLMLLVAIVDYFEALGQLFYGMMVYGIFMVIYLNNAEIRLAFRAERLEADGVNTDDIEGEMV